MTIPTLPDTPPPPADSAMFGIALSYAAQVLVTHPKLNLISVNAKKIRGVVEVQLHLSAISQHELAEIEKVVTERRFTRHERFSDQRVAWWAGSLDGVDVVYAVLAPELPAGARLTCGDCDPPGLAFAIDSDGIAAFFEHARAAHAAHAADGSPSAMILVAAPARPEAS